MCSFVHDCASLIIIVKPSGCDVNGQDQTRKKPPTLATHMEQHDAAVIETICCVEDCDQQGERLCSLVDGELPLKPSKLTRDKRFVRPRARAHTPAQLL